MLQNFFFFKKTSKAFYFISSKHIESCYLGNVGVEELTTCNQCTKRPISGRRSRLECLAKLLFTLQTTTSKSEAVEYIDYN